MNPEICFPDLGITIEHLDRVAFNAFGLPVYWYGIIMVSAIIIAVLYVGREAKRTGQNPELYYDMATFGILGAIVGARAYYVVFSWDSYKDNLIKIFAIREGGLALYGSLIGGVLAVLIYTRIKKQSFLLFTDTIAPAFMLAQAIGRWGNFINREAFGSFTEGLLAMRYLVSTVPYIPARVMEKILTINGAQYIQVHPTFLYESLWNLSGFALLLHFKDRKKYDGQITAYYFIIYGLGRVWIEGLRTDQLQIGSTGIAISQVLSAVFVLAAIAFLFYNKNKPQIKIEAQTVDKVLGETLSGKSFPKPLQKAFPKTCVPHGFRKGSGDESQGFKDCLHSEPQIIIGALCEATETAEANAPDYEETAALKTDKKDKTEDNEETGENI